ncbi:dynein light chain Tctex-type 1-like [Teleopsis dalmanni]|uniref:dynein light chain Tctex-type 1-like n=1 Tax=Teleopsis dalmanni TaxID=139649 RepID=UPI0018CDA0CE|nr:dynein light chain Tctex-type 1-like [Teleopsis dalmanni]
MNLDEDLDYEPNRFDRDEVIALCKATIDNVLGEYIFDSNLAPNWNTKIKHTILKEIIKQQKPFKHCITCLIMQKNGAGIHAANSAYWDVETDDSISVRWESDHMYCMVSVFAFAV